MGNADRRPRVRRSLCSRFDRFFPAARAIVARVRVLTHQQIDFYQEDFTQVDLLLRGAVRPASTFLAIALLGTVLFASEYANAQQSASVAISVKDHRFQPS